jgi:hypothetical protein
MASPACFWRGLTIVTVTLVRVTVYSDSDCEIVISNCRLQRMLTFSREPASGPGANFRERGRCSR